MKSELVSLFFISLLYKTLKFDISVAPRAHVPNSLVVLRSVSVQVHKCPCFFSSRGNPAVMAGSLEISTRLTCEGPDRSSGLTDRLTPLM